MVAKQNKIDIRDARKNDLLKEMFFEQHIGLVYKTAHKFFNMKIDLEERISAGQLGLIKAFNTYDPDLNFAFSTYAIKCIKNEILYEHRKYSTKTKLVKKIQSFDTVIAGGGDGDALLLEDILSLPEEEYTTEDFKAIDNVYKKFIETYSETDPRLIQAFNMFIFENKTTAEIGKILGISQAYGSRIATKAVKLIQEIAIELEIIEGFNKYYKKTPSKQFHDNKNRENKIKQKALYVILNYPELNVDEVSRIVNWGTIKIGLLRRSYNKGTFTLPPDDSIKEKVEKYLETKKLYA